MPLSELWTDVWEVGILALCIWREARSEGEAGMSAVACSVRNRVERASWWGNSYAEVVTWPHQYSSMAQPGDGQLVRYPAPNDEAFATALDIADRIIHEDGVSSPVPGADSFYDDRLKDNPPAWATRDRYVGKVGRLNFYNVDLDFEPERTHVPRFPVQDLPPAVAAAPPKTAGPLAWFDKWRL